MAETLVFCGAHCHLIWAALAKELLTYPIITMLLSVNAHPFTLLIHNQPCVKVVALPLLMAGLHICRRT